MLWSMLSVSLGLFLVALVVASFAVILPTDASPPLQTTSLRLGTFCFWYWQSCWKRTQVEHGLSPLHFFFICRQGIQALITRCLLRGQESVIVVAIESRI